MQVMFFENDGHFGRHLGFLRKLQRDSSGLLVCCSADFSGPILKMSACSELIQAYRLQVMFFENDGHFRRHLEFLGNFQGDSPGLLVCYSIGFSGPILKISACSELVLTYKKYSLKMTAILDAILDFLESSRGILQDF